MTLDDDMGVLVLCRYRLMSNYGEPVFGWKMVKTESRYALMGDFTRAIKKDILSGYMPASRQVDLIAYRIAPGQTL